VCPAVFLAPAVCALLGVARKAPKGLAGRGSRLSTGSDS
jgi:hypothetical protein